MSSNGKTPFFASKRNVVITAVFYTFLWGLAFPLVKICMLEFNISAGDRPAKCLVAGLRFAFSGILTLALYVIFGKNRLSVTARELKRSVLYGITATALQYAFTYIGLSVIDGSKGAVYDQMGVFIIVLSSGLIFKSDKLSAKKVIGCIWGLSGVLCTSVSGDGFRFQPGGDSFMLLAGLCQTTAYFIAKGCLKDMAAEKLVGFGQLIGGVILCIAAYLLGGRIESVNSTAVLSLIGLIIISSVAYTLSLKPLLYFPASEIASFNLLITVFGVVLSAALLNENVWRFNYAAALILCSAGIYLINSVKGGRKYERNNF